MSSPATLTRVGPAEWEHPKGFCEHARVPVRIFATEKPVQAMDDPIFVQAANVATLPGIVGSSLCMPDAHWGHDFPIDGGAARGPSRRARRFRARVTHEV